MNLTQRWRAGGAAFVVATGAILATATGSALADQATTPTATGCPDGWQTLTLDWLASQSPLYRLPFAIDDSSNPDQPGNGDGVVCGKAWDDKRAERVCGGPCAVPVLYTFRDNDVTPTYR